jgi:hypothetical protein
MKQFIISAAASVAVVFYFTFTLRFYKWLYHKGSDGFRKWLEIKTGYSIIIKPGFRSISWEADDNAPLKIKLLVSTSYTVFIIAAGALPIILLGVLSLSLFLMGKIL